jgi:predicted metal-dependent hydrolase
VDALLRTELMARLERDAALIAERFGLRYRVIEPEPPRVRRRYGVCYRDGTIRIRLFHVVTGKPLRYSSLVATLCHELAHLRHFDHSPRFRSFNQRVLAWAREAGIYRPDVERSRERSVPPRATPERERSEGPTQLALFG